MAPGARSRVSAGVVCLLLGACLGRDATEPGSGQTTALLVRADLSATAATTVVVVVTAADITTPLLFNIPVASHLFDDISCHLVGAIPNGIFCEYMPWYDKIYKNPPQVKDGFIEIPKVPGIGWEIDPESFKKFEFKG